eukprot:CAMPEP_0195532256 /NCGR_PEP_ID=MMETSP0794_2-20130614/37677_1 /TAXON_ID=515487 /ORGANISM="Stephanopyxis turris, Strain CCMP 815" /LENGTH=392 /DNA_ID=CAMNT_0040664395 /DNA_START=17 /DNA_END=1195 /DNA_ORIENTATION=-
MIKKTTGMKKTPVSPATCISPKDPVSHIISGHHYPQSIRTIQKRKSNTSNTFATELMKMLVKEDKDNPDSIKWLDGKMFVILDVRYFEEIIMPKYFSMTRLKSFRRKLTDFGFQRVREGKEKGAYWHDKFLREKPELCTEIQRKKVVSKTPTISIPDEKADALKYQPGNTVKPLSPVTDKMTPTQNRPANTILKNIISPSPIPASPDSNALSNATPHCISQVKDCVPERDPVCINNGTKKRSVSCKSDTENKVSSLEHTNSVFQQENFDKINPMYKSLVELTLKKYEVSQHKEQMELRNKVCEKTPSFSKPAYESVPVVSDPASAHSVSSLSSGDSINEATRRTSLKSKPRSQAVKIKKKKQTEVVDKFCYKTGTLYLYRGNNQRAVYVQHA